MAWYHTYFEGLPQQAWKLNQDDETTQWEVEFLHEMLELSPEGSHVLDLLSGYGRHALPLAEAGHRLCCVDISAEYCAELREQAAAQALPLTVVEGDALTVALPEASYDAAYCMGNSLHFFPYNDMLRFFERIAQQLRPEARLVLHSQLLMESVLPHFQERTWMPVGDMRYLMESEYDAAAGCLRSEVIHLHGQEEHRRHIQQHLYSLAELIRMLNQAGFDVTDTFSSLEGDPFQLGDEQLYLVAKKKATA